MSMVNLYGESFSSKSIILSVYREHFIVMPIVKTKETKETLRVHRSCPQWSLVCEEKWHGAFWFILAHCETGASPQWNQDSVLLRWSGMRGQTRANEGILSPSNTRKHPRPPELPPILSGRGRDEGRGVRAWRCPRSPLYIKLKTWRRKPSMASVNTKGAHHQLTVSL